MNWRVILLFLSLFSYAESPNFIFILSDDQSWKGSSVLMDEKHPESKSDYFQTFKTSAVIMVKMEILI